MCAALVRLSCRIRRYSAAASSGEGGSPAGGDGGGAGEGMGVADDTFPLDNSLDHMVSAVAGNGEVVARAVSARNLVQVREA